MPDQTGCFVLRCLASNYAPMPRIKGTTTDPRSHLQPSKSPFVERCALNSDSPHESPDSESVKRSGRQRDNWASAHNCGTLAEHLN